jgi:hypothetical protein
VLTHNYYLKEEKNFPILANQRTRTKELPNFSNFPITALGFPRTIIALKKKNFPNFSQSTYSNALTSKTPGPWYSLQ